MTVILILIQQQEIQNTECKRVCEAIIILFLGHESVTLFPKIILLITRAYYLSSEGVPVLRSYKLY